MWSLGRFPAVGPTIAAVVVAVGCTSTPRAEPSSAVSRSPSPSEHDVGGAPATSASPNDETTSAGEPVPSSFPETIVVALEDGRIAEVDARSGEVRRVVTVLPSHETEAGSSSVTGVLRDRSGNVYVDGCCEPAAGRILVFDAAGIETGALTGYDATIDDDGMWMFANSSGFTVVIRLADGETRMVGCCENAESTYLLAPSFSPDGRFIVGGDHHLGHLRIRALDAEDAEDDRFLTPPRLTRWRTPEWRADGRLIAVEHHETDDGPAYEWVGVLVDPRTGQRLGEWDVAGEVASMGYDRSRTWLLITYADGRLQWQGRGQSGWILDAGVVSADW